MFFGKFLSSSFEPFCEEQFSSWSQSVKADFMQSYSLQGCVNSKLRGRPLCLGLLVVYSSLCNCVLAFVHYHTLVPSLSEVKVKKLCWCYNITSFMQLALIKNPVANTFVE